MSCPFAKSMGTSSHEELTNQKASEQCEACLERVNATTTCVDGQSFDWPNMLDVTSHVYNSDYESILCDRTDTKESKKVLCSNGFIGSVRVEWTSKSNYSGLFTGESVDHGIIRLSSALYVDRAQLPWYSRALTSAELFPCVAMKFFRNNSHSGNLLFGGKKTGQDHSYFFNNGVCTHLTEKVPIFLSWVQSLFSRYSSYPVQLGVSDFAAIDQDGVCVSPEEVNFPWCVALIPHCSSSVSEDCAHADDPHPINLQEISFNQLSDIPVGTTLYDIYAFESPHAAMDAYNSGSNTLQYLGKVVTTSALLPSDANTDIFVKHQRKEEDYALKPEWEELASQDKAGNNVLGRIGASFIENILGGKFS